MNQGYITEEGMTRALLAMQCFKNTLDEQGIKNVKLLERVPSETQSMVLKCFNR